MNDSVKIMMWCVPRSCSTAFSKAISQQENSRIVMEPFADAYYYGTERVSDRYTDIPAKSSMTFSDIRQSLEQDYNDYSVVFAKDMAYYISEHMSRSNEVVPKGYKHVFLIRNPKKTVTSLYKNSIGKLDGFDYFDPAEAEFKSLHDLFFKLKEETGETPVLVDAADLLENPDRMLNLFCMKTGLPFSKEMLSWDQGGMKDLETAWPGWQATLTQSTGFTKPASPKNTEELQISEEAKQAIEENMPYYNTLYQYRITY